MSLDSTTWRTGTAVLVAALAAALAAPAGAEDIPLVPLCAGEEPTIVGTPSDDVLRGTAGNDVIDGRGGDDKILGRGGDDIICGGGGADTIRGGAGDDRLFGEAGDDRIFAGAGRNSLAGKAGRDFIVGGPDRDKILGGVGDDYLAAGDDALEDFCDGGRGFDWVELGCGEVASAIGPQRGGMDLGTLSTLFGRIHGIGELDEFGLRGGDGVRGYGGGLVEVAGEFPMAYNVALYKDGPALLVLSIEIDTQPARWQVVDVVLSRPFGPHDEILNCFSDDADIRRGGTIGIVRVPDGLDLDEMYRPLAVWQADADGLRWNRVAPSEYRCAV